MGLSYEYIYASDGTGETPRLVVAAERFPNAENLIVHDTARMPHRWIATSGVVSDGVFDDATVQVFYGHTEGGILVIDDMAPGYVDRGHQPGEIVVLKPTTLWADTVADAIRSNDERITLVEAKANPGGSNTQVQYNDNGDFAGSSNLTFDGDKLKVKDLEVSHNLQSQTMPQISGSPIIDSGSGWIRYADGTQICYKTAASVSGNMTGHGSNFYKEASVGSWAKPFTAIPVVTANCSNEWIWCNVNSWSTTSGGTARFWRSVNATTAFTAYIMAIGRWK